jgi:hypothetical protein
MQICIPVDSRRDDLFDSRVFLAIAKPGCKRSKSEQSTALARFAPVNVGTKLGKYSDFTGAGDAA